jgi:fructosamine-3-kinase
MAPHEVEVSWQELRQIVREWAGSVAELDEVTPMAGGAINTTLCLHTKAGDRAVLKITPHRVDRAYADEQHQLDLLREVGVPVPQIYLCKIGSLENPFSYLLMEFIEGVDLAAARAQCPPEKYDELQEHLAKLVLLMHERRSPHYMRVTASEPTRYDDWPKCYRDIFAPIWREVEKAGALPIKAKKTMAKVHERLERLLAHSDCPRLVHWDLWSTNVLARPDSEGCWRIVAMLDPNCKYAHCEAEIAYLELFHTITPAFMKAYQSVHRMAPEYHRARRQVYQLYSLLNHLHLFGNEYLKSFLAMLDKVASLI